MIEPELSAINRQVGGEHYKKYAIQPIVLAETLQMPPMLYSAFKYVCRFKDKNGSQDLEKALHCVHLLNEQGGKGINRQVYYRHKKLVLEFISQFIDDLDQLLLLHDIIRCGIFIRPSNVALAISDMIDEYKPVPVPCVAKVG